MALRIAAKAALQKGVEGVQSLQRRTALNINIILMEEEYLKTLIAQLNINLDKELLEDIKNVLDHPCLYGLDERLDSLSIYAVACIVVQCKRLLGIDQHSQVGVGLPTERFLVKLSPEIRFPLISRIDELASRWPGCPTYLSEKMRTLEKNYSRFLKSKQVFSELCTAALVPSKLVYLHFKIFWLAYLEIKQKGNLYNSQERQLSLLTDLLRCLFEGYLYNLDQKEVSRLLGSHFMEETAPKDKNGQIYHSALDAILFNIFSLRGSKPDHKTLVQRLQNADYSTRFVDDFYWNVTPKYQNLASVRVNQTVFLEMDFSLTPMAIYKSQPHGSSISQKISLLDDDSEGNPQFPELSASQNVQIEPQSSQPCSNHLQMAAENIRPHIGDSSMKIDNSFDSLMSHSSQPTSLISKGQRMNALKWVQQHYLEQNKENAPFSRVYNDIFGEDFQLFRKRYTQLAKRVIEKHSPQCLDIEARCKKTMSLFLSMMGHLSTLKTQDELKDIFKGGPTDLSSFFCLGTILMNYIYKSPEPYSLQILETFGLDVKMAFIPINWIGQNMNLLPVLLKYLSAIECHMLLFDLWQKRCGFDLLESVKVKKVTYLDMALYHRLKQYISYRINRMSQKDDKLASWVSKIVNGLKKECSIILKHNSINTIIIAAFAVVLGKGNHEEGCRQSLKRWHSLDKLINEELTAKDNEGRVVDLTLFVSNIFLKEFQIWEEKYRCEQELKQAPKKQKTLNLKKKETFLRVSVFGELGSFKQLHKGFKRLSHCEQKPEQACIREYLQWQQRSE